LPLHVGFEILPRPLSVGWVLSCKTSLLQSGQN